MRPVPCATHHRAACGACLPRRTLGFGVVLVACLLVATSCRHDPLQQLDASIIGAVITGRCNPEVTLDTSRGAAVAALGRQAYEQILRDMQARHPNNLSNEEKADRAFKHRIEAVEKRGEQMVEEKGCANPEIQKRLRKFLSGN